MWITIRDSSSKLIEGSQKKIESSEKLEKDNINNDFEENQKKIEVAKQEQIKKDQQEAEILSDAIKSWKIETEEWLVLIESNLQENLEEKKSRIDKIFENRDKIKDNKKIISIFNRQATFNYPDDINEILKENDYPERTKITELNLDEWKVNLNKKFIKDGYCYLLRWDHPNLDKKWFYSRTYGYWKLSTKELSQKFKSSEEVGYALYDNEKYLTGIKPKYNNPSEELLFHQSRRWWSSFISTTTSIPCAKYGTWNTPNLDDQKNYEIYVIKIPVEYVINSNTNNNFWLEEDEYLIPDFIPNNEIIKKFPRENTEELFEYLKEILDISREDVRLD